MISGSFKNKVTNYSLTNHIYKQDLALNNLQELRCHTTQPNETQPNYYLGPE